jgi:hypothetical protein
MTERPLLILPEPVPTGRARRGGGGDQPRRYPPDLQQQRLGPRLDELEAAFEAKRLTLQTSTTGLIPEEVLVLETVGSVQDFYKAVARIQGMEFLDEYDENDTPPDDSFLLRGSGADDTSMDGRVYLVFSDQLAFQQLRRLWRRWLTGERLAHGLTKWRDLFSQLRDIRPWSVDDRLSDTGVLSDWHARIAWGPERLPCEVELWFRSDEHRRNEASEQVRFQVQQLGGLILSEALLPDIHYHALAVELPMAVVQTLLDNDLRGDIALVQMGEIQFFRASGQIAGRVTLEETHPLSQSLQAPLPSPEPSVALLDGLPLQAHSALAGRLRIDDPDDVEASYPSQYRLHGTAMASLIVWGDLHAPGQPIPQCLYVRPILQPIAPSWTERSGEGVLIVDLIHRAVQRMFEGEAGGPPSAPQVVAINLSIGIADRPFDGTMSPLARLLDWLAWKYKVLFLISAGNHANPINVTRPWSELEHVSTEELQLEVLLSILADSRHRRLLSPAEAINGITVGALHHDEDAAPLRANWINPSLLGQPSLVNAHGPGYKRSVKPEVLASGGRVALSRPLLGSAMTLSLPGIDSYRPGHLVATASTSPGNLTATLATRGTSNATAMMTRAAAHLVPVLNELREFAGGEVVNDVPSCLWLKTLLVHSARWGQVADDLMNRVGASTPARKASEMITRILGFGSVDTDTLTQCTPLRVTALSGGRLSKDEGAEHRFPLPPQLSGKRGFRRLIVTLSWMSPVNPRNHRWRKAHLWFETPTSTLQIGSKKHLERTCVDFHAVQRGTVQHEVFEGEKAVAFVDGDDIVINVSCREDAIGLTGEIPYALAVTLEVAEGIGVDDIYTEVRDRVQSRLRVQERVDIY